MATETLQKPSRKETGMCEHNNFPATCHACQRIPGEEETDYASRLSEALHPPRLSPKKLQKWKERGEKIFGKKDFKDIFGKTFQEERFLRLIDRTTTEKELLDLQKIGEKILGEEEFRLRFTVKMVNALENIKKKKVA